MRIPSRRVKPGGAKQGPRLQNGRGGSRQADPQGTNSYFRDVETTERAWRTYQFVRGRDESARVDDPGYCDTNRSVLFSVRVPAPPLAASGFSTLTVPSLATWKKNPPVAPTSKL